jgi:N-methylhydantoinase A/oxoprolinase/acetone carboxylase beta subunit
MTRVGTDTGGTFTDLVTEDGRVAKVPSTPDDPGRALRSAVDGVDPGSGVGSAVGSAGRPTVLTHGTTVATNALLERAGATVALVTNQGLADVIEIGRQDRPSLYDQTVDRPEPLVERRLRYEVAGRLDASGAELEPVDLAGLPDIDAAADAVAVVLLHADLQPAHEQAVAAALRARGHDVSESHQVSPEFREVERTVTTVANAYLRPVCRAYLEGLAGLADQVAIMTSAGGLVPVDAAAARPVDLVLSGPAGGVQAAAAAAVANGWPDAVTFDMGGTSTDVCLVLDGRPAPAAERMVGGFALRVAALDVHTIGAGGGSIASIDAGGALTVGPRSAGAVPGPACYGRGGTRPTVTDADLVAGRLPPGLELPGLGALDLDAARAALDRAGVQPQGVIAVVEAAMTEAVRAVTVARGVDPRGLALVAFGGAGPLHACGLADALGMATVIVPARAGVLSAAGILCADEQRDLVRSWPTPGDHADLDAARDELAHQAAALLGVGAPEAGVHPVELEVETWLDCRYVGQSHELAVGAVEGFPFEHERRNGYAMPDAPIEVIAIRARARRPSPLSLTDLPAPPRSTGVGPCVIAEPDCTIWVPPGWRADPGAAGALVLTRVAWPDQS